VECPQRHTAFVSPEFLPRWINSIGVFHCSAAIKCHDAAVVSTLASRTIAPFWRFLRRKQLEKNWMIIKSVTTTLAATGLLTMLGGTSASAQSFAAPWTGPYLGASVGTGTAKTIWSSADFNNFESKGGRALGGLQGGYNFQTGNIIVGAEADYMFSSLKGSATCPNGVVTCGSDTKGLGSVRGRLGWAIAPPAMLYFTGGLAWGNTQWSATPTLGGTSANFSHTSAGYVFGGGAEFLLAKNWSLKAEYLHYNLGSIRTAPGEFVANAVDLKPRADTFKLGVNFKF
jgi:outer membrane immunogenic protein